MTPDDERRELLARVIEKNKGVEGLSANPDFQAWLELVPKAELSIIRDAIVNIDRTQANWREIVCDLVIEYQGVRKRVIDPHEFRVTAVAKAREGMKELDKR